MICMNIIEFLRQFRVSEYAIFDVAIAFVGMYFLAPWLSKIFLKVKIYVPKQHWLYLTLPLGILIHLLMGTITPMTRDVIVIDDHYVLKVLIVGMIFLGMRGIKRVR